MTTTRAAKLLMERKRRMEAPPQDVRSDEEGTRLLAALIRQVRPFIRPTVPVTDVVLGETVVRISTNPMIVLVERQNPEGDVVDSYKVPGTQDLLQALGDVITVGLNRCLEKRVQLMVAKLLNVGGTSFVVRVNVDMGSAVVTLVHGDRGVWLFALATPTVAH